MRFLLVIRCSAPSGMALPAWLATDSVLRVSAAATTGRTAFTWRLTADQALMLDDMMLRLKRQLGRPKLDRAEMLLALVALADESSGVFGALVARMQADQAS